MRTDRAKAPNQQPPLTQEALVAAALLVLERDGLDALSMRKVAAELGVQAPSLYWHVRNKEQLLDLLADALVADAEPPPRVGDWREQLRAYCHLHRRHLHGKRDAARVVAGRFNLGPSLLVILEDQLDRLQEAGFPAAEAALTSYLLGNYVTGFVLQEQSPLSAAEAVGHATRTEVVNAARDHLQQLPADRFPHLVALAVPLSEPNMEDRFAFGLERILDGLATLLEPERGTR
ncbi:TetR/AcrR family transcriptional regulator [Streptomyces sp. SPB162]|uniref:TetR/AcrR family transcriptional regulator n=1 Tax=Streptomyces sp. SPB162 TaxID=2940560 RepID=UPI0024058877|nr:TetR/AcrR family transcriptional regulator [Streptomyces sp. SPB162]MDF9811155.1 TetR/AcrR family tetracycline transcriptional repressor [Streptomyces sp. SPB162]